MRVLLIISTLCSVASSSELCDRFVFDRDTVSFTEPERKLLCGDPANRPWSVIPPAQAMFNFRNFLQGRGYYQASFEQREGKIFVRIGPQTRVSAFNVTWKSVEPLDFTLASKMRKIVGEVLTPSLLDETKARLVKRVESEGYPCPDVVVTANSITGELTAVLDPGPRQNVAEIHEENVPGLVPEIFARYRAFHVNERFNADYLAVTTSRILDEGLVQSAYFTTKCGDKGTILTHKFIAGAPRLITLGIGFDTEKLAMARASWRNSRLGPTGSILDFSILGAIREQELRGGMKWYLLPRASRFFVKPEFQIKRENYKHYDRTTGKARGGPGLSWDGQHARAEFFAGPAAIYTHTARGYGPRNSALMAINSEILVRTHYFEFYRANPTTGFEARLEFDLVNKDWLAPVSAQKFKLSFQNNWNLGGYHPPLLVLGVRGGFGTTFTPELLDATDSRLPNEFRHYLGGSESVRGFGVNELPSKQGALTSAHLGTELRLVEVLPWKLQPLVFGDVAIMGARPVSFEGPVFWSPGIGMRWQSPVGVFRVTGARGLLSGPPKSPEQVPGWRFFLSFGEEF